LQQGPYILVPDCAGRLAARLKILRQAAQVFAVRFFEDGLGQIRIADEGLRLNNSLPK